MKKFLNSLIIIFVFMFIGIVDVKAVDASIKKESNNKYTFSWNGVENYSNYLLKYNNATLTEASNIETSGELRISSGMVTFQPSITSGTITFSIVKNDIGNDVLISKSINFGTTTSKQEQTTTANTTTTTQAPKSNNANLKSIVVKTPDDSVVTLSPNFSPSLHEYEASVASNLKTVNIEAIMEDSKANLIISNNVNDELIAGENNKITITVTAEDGTKKQYVVNVKREALTADATLSSLTIKEYKDFEFKSDKFNYVIKVKNNVKKLTLDYVLSDENATAKVEGNEDLKDGSKVKVIVTAQDGTKKVYTFEISKASEGKKQTNNVVAEKNPLIIMGLSIFAFGLIGGIVYVIKK